MYMTFPRLVTLRFIEYSGSYDIDKQHCREYVAQKTKSPMLSMEELDEYIALIPRLDHYNLVVPEIKKRDEAASAATRLLTRILRHEEKLKELETNRQLLIAQHEASITDVGEYTKIIGDIDDRPTPINTK